MTRIEGSVPIIWACWDGVGKLGVYGITLGCCRFIAESELSTQRPSVTITVRPEGWEKFTLE